jgi:hypothetical protein
LFKNELLGEADPIVTIVFCGLWCLADREGRLEDRPKRIKAEILPYRECHDFNGYLTVLQQLGFIDRYEIKGLPIIQVINFEKHQSPHKTEKASELPENPNRSNSCCVHVKAPLDNESITDEAALIPDSLNIDSLKKDMSRKRDDVGETITKTDFDGQAKQLGIDPDLWTEWMANRKKLKAQNTPRAMTTLINRIKQLQAKGFKPNDLVEVANERGWKTVYEPKEAPNGKPTLQERLLDTSW